MAVTAMLAGCGNSSLNEDETTFHVRSLNLVEDSPTLEIDLDDTTMFTAGYGAATSFTAGHPGQHTLSFSAILPADLDDDDDDDETSTPVSGASAYTFLAGTEYTVVTYGRMDDIQTFMIEGLDQREAVDDDKLVLQFTHASPDTPAVDVYVTAVKAGITSRYYVDTLSLTETSDPMELSLIRDDDDLDDDATLSADVVVELMAAGTTDLLYRSAAITFAEQNRVMMAIANANGPGPAVTKLLVVGGSDQRDYREGAALRFVHICAQRRGHAVCVFRRVHRFGRCVLHGVRNGTGICGRCRGGRHGRAQRADAGKLSISARRGQSRRSGAVGFVSAAAR